MNREDAIDLLREARAPAAQINAVSDAVSRDSIVAKPCILCGRLTHSRGLFSPRNPAEWGGNAHQDRYIIYPYCEQEPTDGSTASAVEFLIQQQIRQGSAKPNSPFVKTAAQAIEMQCYLVSLFTEKGDQIKNATLERERQIRGPHVHQEDTKHVLRIMSEILAGSEVVLWNPVAFEAAARGRQAFIGTHWGSQFLLLDGQTAIRPQLWFMSGDVWEWL